ncbi:MAG: STAS domain-containing protein [Chromatiales bacterium]|nr:STAS domain-containing protein [Chromatiales bacterium]
MANASISGGEGRYAISGEMSFDTVTALLNESRSTLFAAPSESLEVDLGAVSRADSAGLALLVQWVRMASEQHRSIRFAHLPPQLLAIAHAGELDGVLPLTDQPQQG